MTAAVDTRALARQIREARGVGHKRDIDAVVRRLGLGSRHAAVPVGDDCAAIPDGDGHLLLAIEGFLDSFVADDPYFAGYCGIMVNLSDVAAMGGRPLAVVDALWSLDGAAADPVLAGLSDAAALYGVPVVGGHTNTRAAAGNLAVAVLGRAGPRLLTSFDAAPGDDLVAAIDLRGRFRDPHPYWDASTGAPGARLGRHVPQQDRVQHDPERPAAERAADPEQQAHAGHAGRLVDGGPVARVAGGRAYLRHARTSSEGMRGSMPKNSVMCRREIRTLSVQALKCDTPSSG